MLEIFIGMMSIALITGVSFARFSRPRARIVFTHSPVVRMLNGEPALTLRAANARNNVIIDASARLRLLQDEVSAEGVSFRKLHDLALVREQHPMFVLAGPWCTSLTRLVPYMKETPSRWRPSARSLSCPSTA